MAGDNFARRTVGVTRIRRAGEDGPPVADASMSQIDPARSRQGPSQRTPPASRPDHAADHGTRWHQAAYVSPQREPHGSPHSVEPWPLRRDPNQAMNGRAWVSSPLLPKSPRIAGGESLAGQPDSEQADPEARSGKPAPSGRSAMPTTIDPTSQLTGRNVPTKGSRATLQQVLLACGIGSSAAYVAANLAGALRGGGYSSVHQSVSELTA